MAQYEFECLREGSAMSETGLLPAYLIVGTDGVKRDHAVSRMKARLEKSGMVEFNLDERDMTKDPDIE